MPVRIFYVQGNKSIGELEREINKWQISLAHLASSVRAKVRRPPRSVRLLSRCLTCLVRGQ
jgi:hypothetical protein